jgi:1-deoxy-D-xylulose-5-phosphate synthase
VVHVRTVKGKGYEPAETDPVDRLHAVPPARTGPAPVVAPRAPWTRAFAEELLAVGTRRPDVVALTAAMLEPTGLAPFAAAFPGRTVDVGIAEQHAVTAAAGLAMGGLHPVVAVYATFLNRAFDQVLMDVALHRCGVTFVLDRAGVTGDDGASHNGMWDMSILQVVPGLRIAAPRDASRLRELLREAVAVDDGPTVVRFPKGTLGADVPAVDSVAGMDVLRRSGECTAESGVLLVSVGSMAETCLAVADRLAARGIGVTVVDPRWVKPVNAALVPLAREHGLVVTVEDNVLAGGFGAAVAEVLADEEVRVPLLRLGIPDRFLPHGKRDVVLAELGLDAVGIAERVRKALHRMDASQ